MIRLFNSVNSGPLTFLLNTQKPKRKGLRASLAIDCNCAVSSFSVIPASRCCAISEIVILAYFASVAFCVFKSIIVLSQERPMRER